MANFAKPIKSMVIVCLVPIFTCSLLISGCVIKNNHQTLKPPAGHAPDQFNADIRECLEWARKFRDTPLNQEEQSLLNGLETARFFEGGRGRNGFSDQYVLCLVKRGYEI